MYELTILTVAIVTLIALALLVAVFLIGRLFGTMTREHTYLQDRLTEQEQRIAELTSNNRVHTHSTVAGIEDAQAVGLDLVLKIQSLETELAAARARAEQQLSILGIVRQSPSSYDSNRPAGNRPQGWNS